MYLLVKATRRSIRSDEYSSVVVLRVRSANDLIGADEQRNMQAASQRGHPLGRVEVVAKGIWRRGFRPDHKPGATVNGLTRQIQVPDERRLCLLALPSVGFEHVALEKPHTSRFTAR